MFKNFDFWNPDEQKPNNLPSKVLVNESQVDWSIFDFSDWNANIPEPEDSERQKFFGHVYDSKQQSQSDDSSPFLDAIETLGRAAWEGVKTVGRAIAHVDYTAGTSTNYTYTDDFSPLMTDDLSFQNSSMQSPLTEQLYTSQSVPDSIINTQNNRQSIADRLNTINSVVQNDPVLSQDYSGSYLANQYPSGGKPGIFSQANPNIADANFKHNNPALNTQNGSEVEYQYNPQKNYKEVNPQVEFGMNATMDGLSSYNPGSPANALPELEQMKRAQQQAFLDAAQTPERARQQYQKRGQQNTVPVTRRFGFVDGWGKNGLKYKLSPERKEKLRQEIEAERNNPLNKNGLPKAFYESRYEGKVDLWKKLEAGKVLDEAEAKQLFHSNNLFRLKDKNNAENQRIADTSDMVSTNQMVKNMVTNTSQNDDGKYLVNSLPVDKKTLEKLALENVKYLQKHDKFMSFTQLNKRARDLQAIQDAAAENEFISASQSSEDASKLALGGTHDADLNANNAFGFLDNSYNNTGNSKATKNSPSLLIQVGTLYDDWRESLGEPVDHFTGKLKSGVNPLTTPDKEVYSVEKFTETIQKAGKLDTLVVSGHGSATSVGKNSIINMANFTEAFSPYINNEAPKPDIIYFLACETANERFSISQQLSLVLNDTIIIAPQTRIIAPWSIPYPNKIPPYLVFKNGKIIEKRF